MIFTSRYDVFGPPNGCKGDCEGTGFIPIKKGDFDNKLYAIMWYLMEVMHPANDLWHFVPCPLCKNDDKIVRAAKEILIPTGVKK